MKAFQYAINHESRKYRQVNTDNAMHELQEGGYIRNTIRMRQL